MDDRATAVKLRYEEGRFRGDEAKLGLKKEECDVARVVAIHTFGFVRSSK